MHYVSEETFILIQTGEYDATSKDLPTYIEGQFRSFIAFPSDWKILKDGWKNITERKRKTNESKLTDFVKDKVYQKEYKEAAKKVLGIVGNGPLKGDVVNKIAHEYPHIETRELLRYIKRHKQ